MDDKEMKKVNELTPAELESVSGGTAEECYELRDFMVRKGFYKGDPHGFDFDQVANFLADQIGIEGSTLDLGSGANIYYGSFHKEISHAEVMGKLRAKFGD